MNAVFPRTRPRASGPDCAYPLKLLRYGDADVLLVNKGAPEDALCHGCGGVLSAFVLRRMPTGPKVVASFVDFAEKGSNGNPGEISGIRLGAHDAFGVESGGTFQGYSGTTLAFFIFRDGRLEAVKPDLPLSASNGGAMDDVDDSKATLVEGAWRIDPARPDTVTIDYVTTIGKASHRASATWVLKDTAFSLVSGKPPKEYGAASGNGP